MKRIGILTFHNAENYGAMLQAYALKQHLEKENPSAAVGILDYRNPHIELSYKYFKPWSFFKHKGAAKILAVSDAELLEKLKAYTVEMKEAVQAKAARLDEVGYEAY